MLAVLIGVNVDWTPKGLHACVGDHGDLNFRGVSVWIDISLVLVQYHVRSDVHPEVLLELEEVALGCVPTE